MILVFQFSAAQKSSPPWGGEFAEVTHCRGRLECSFLSIIDSMGYILCCPSRLLITSSGGKDSLGEVQETQERNTDGDRPVQLHRPCS
jgi:hypothetical protein